MAVPVHETPIFKLSLSPDKQSGVFEYAETPWEGRRAKQLALDVVDTPKEIVVISPMAGALAQKIEVVLHGDLLTIRGVRHNPLSNLTQTNFHYAHQECFWGTFSHNCPSRRCAERASKRGV